MANTSLNIGALSRGESAVTIAKRALGVVVGQSTANVLFEITTSGAINFLSATPPSANVWYSINTIVELP